MVQLILAAGGMGAWAAWVFTGNSWKASKGRFIFEMGCCLNPDGSPLLDTNATEAGGRLAAATACLTAGLNFDDPPDYSTVRAVAASVIFDEYGSAPLDGSWEQA